MELVRIWEADTQILHVTLQRGAVTVEISVQHSEKVK